MSDDGPRPGPIFEYKGHMVFDSGECNCDRGGDLNRHRLECGLEPVCIVAEWETHPWRVDS